jgi:hypothetical protein
LLVQGIDFGLCDVVEVVAPDGDVVFGGIFRDSQTPNVAVEAGKGSGEFIPPILAGEFEPRKHHVKKAIFFKESGGIAGKLDAERVAFLAGIPPKLVICGGSGNRTEEEGWIRNDLIKAKVANGFEEIALKTGDIRESVPAGIELSVLHGGGVEVDGIDALGVAREKSGEKAATRTEIESVAARTWNHQVGELEGGQGDPHEFIFGTRLQGVADGKEQVVVGL